MTACNIEITRLLEHAKIRPTNIIFNTVFIILKNYGYKDIPRIQFPESGTNVIEKYVITDYCKKIINMLEYEPDDEDAKKKNSSKEIHMFQESSMLPQNVYVSEKKDEEKLEEHYANDDVTTASESENSAGSELEEEGYEIYEANDSDGFSE
jgi:hypothetical protein